MQNTHMYFRDRNKVTGLYITCYYSFSIVHLLLGQMEPQPVLGDQMVLIHIRAEKVLYFFVCA